MHINYLLSGPLYLYQTYKLICVLGSGCLELTIPLGCPMITARAAASSVLDMPINIEVKDVHSHPVNTNHGCYTGSQSVQTMGVIQAGSQYKPWVLYRQSVQTLDVIQAVSQYKPWMLYRQAVSKIISLVCTIDVTNTINNKNNDIT